MPNGDHIPTILGEGKAYLNGKEYDLSEFYASGLSDTLTEATNSEYCNACCGGGRAEPNAWGMHFWRSSRSFHASCLQGGREDSAERRIAAPASNRIEEISKPSLTFHYRYLE